MQGSSCGGTPSGHLQGSPSSPRNPHTVHSQACRRTRALHNLGKQAQVTKAMDTDRGLAACRSTLAHRLPTDTPACLIACLSDCPQTNKIASKLGADTDSYKDHPAGRRPAFSMCPPGQRAPHLAGPLCTALAWCCAALQTLGLCAADRRESCTARLRAATLHLFDLKHHQGEEGKGRRSRRPSLSPLSTPGALSCATGMFW